MALHGSRDLPYQLRAPTLPDQSIDYHHTTTPCPIPVPSSPCGKPHLRSDRLSMPISCICITALRPTPSSIGYLRRPRYVCRLDLMSGDHRPCASSEWAVEAWDRGAARAAESGTAKRGNARRQVGCSARPNTEPQVTSASKLRLRTENNRISRFGQRGGVSATRVPLHGH